VRVLDLVNPPPELRRELDALAGELIPDFRAMIGELAGAHDSLPWLLSYPVSGHSYGSRLFERCLVIRCIASSRAVGGERGIGKIRTADRELAQCLKDQFQEMEWEIEVDWAWKDSPPEPSRIAQWFGSVRQMAISIWLLTGRFLFRKPSRREQFRDPITVVDTFLLEDGSRGGLPVGGKFVDRYFDGLREHLPDDIQEQLVFWPTILGGKRHFRRQDEARASGDRFIIADDWLSWSDFFQLLASPYRIRRTAVPEVRFDGIKIDRLVASEMQHTAGNWSSMSGYLYYLAIHAMAKDGVKITHWLDWYENQVIDRGVMRALHEAYPDVPVTGYQGFAVCPVFNHYLIPSAKEIDLKLAPDKVVMPSAKLVERARRYGSPIELTTGPAFRFQSSMEDDGNPDSSKRETEVLVPLPISWIESEQLLAFLSEVSAALSEGCTIRIRPHPLHDIGRLRQLVETVGLGASVEADGSFADAMKRAEVVVGLSSSTCVEAFVAGRSVAICSVGGLFTQNPTRWLPGAEERVEVCYSPNDLVSALKKFKGTHHPVDESFFQAVTDEGCLQLIGG
jgi:hypothetical protein